MTKEKCNSCFLLQVDRNLLTPFMQSIYTWVQCWTNSKYFFSNLLKIAILSSSLIEDLTKDVAQVYKMPQHHPMMKKHNIDLIHSH